MTERASGILFFASLLLLAMSFAYWMVEFDAHDVFARVDRIAEIADRNASVLDSGRQLTVCDASSILQLIRDKIDSTIPAQSVELRCAEVQANEQ